MAQKLDPDEWERDMKRIDNRLAERRVSERRRRDRWGRYIERGALLVLVVLYIIGFRTSDHQRAEIQRDERQLAHQQQRLVRQEERNRQLAVTIAKSRAATVQVFCRELNHHNAVLRGMIVGGAKGSKPFERVYRQFGFPPYRTRLAQAERHAHRLDPLDCKALVPKVP